jgi:hypothetical protein
MNSDKLIAALYESIGETCISEPDIAHIEVHGNDVLGVHQVPGLEVECESLTDGVLATMTVRSCHRIDRPVRLCFGLLDETGKQNIDMKIRIEDGARVTVLASGTFPNAVDVIHAMDTQISVGKEAECIYLERRLHGSEGGLSVIPRARIHLDENAVLRTDFELVKGRVGRVKIEYEAECLSRSVLDMAVRISGRGDDEIKICEKAHLKGEAAHGVLRTSVAVTDRAVADIKNTLIASAPLARGHVACREIVRRKAIASAVPIVEVQHPRARVTHEASIGSVDAKQLESLMGRGLTEEEATGQIIEGLLSPDHADGS